MNQQQYPNNNRPYNNWPNNYGPYNNRPNPKKPKDELSIGSMVLGILSIVANCAFTWGVVFSITMGISAVILGALYKDEYGKKNGMAITGIITGSIGVLVGLAIIVLYVFVIRFSFHMFRNMPYRDYGEYLSIFSGKIW